MSRRDYRSYNILGDEMHKTIDAETITQEEGVKKTKLSKDEIKSEIISNNVESESQDDQKEILIDSKQNTEMSNEEEKEDIDNELNEINVTSDKESINVISKTDKKSYINKINATLDKIGTSKVKSTPIELASIESGDKEIFTDQRKTEQVHVGQTYKESHNNINDISEEKVEMDTSFSNYKHNYQNKERSKFVKWSMRVIKVILLIMLLPLISIIGAAILTFLGCFIAGILGSIGVGVMLIGITSFFSTQISPMLIALGITSSITVLALGAILTILFIMMIKQIKKLTQKYRKTRKVSSREAR